MADIREKVESYDKNMRVYNLVAGTPKEATKTIKGGRLAGMSDINPMYRIKRLTEIFGPAGQGWKTENHSYTEKEFNGEVIVMCQIYLRVKWEDGTWSEPIYGVGGSHLVTMEKSGPYFDDEAYKKAYTDAISVACKALGIAADIYFSKDSTKYTVYGEYADSDDSTDDGLDQEQKEFFKPKKTGNGGNPFA